MSTSAQPDCPMCQGRGVLLGRLGQLRWYRCRSCAMDFNRPSHAALQQRPASKQERTAHESVH